MRLSAASDLHINSFGGGVITELESGVTNGMVEKRGEVLYLTQRPSIDVFEDAGTYVADARGRAIYYWEVSTDLYILNNGTLYRGSQSNSISTSPTAGTKKCHFFELGNTLILLDAENDQGFTISAADAVTEITDVDFPPKQTPAVGLAQGGAVLDGYLFVLDVEGVVYSSANGDPTTWSALDFKEAERDPDAGVYLGKHHDNLAVFGAKTIEFFYNAGNATGSPLNRRQDVAYNIGCSNGESVWEEGDRIFFVGVNYSGALGVYTLENFQIRKISTSTLDSFLTQSIVKSGISVTGLGLSSGGHIFYLLTVHTTPSDISPSITLVYDDTTGFWGEWDTDVNDIDKFPLVSWTKRSGATERAGEGILSNGDLITLNDDLTPQDTLLGDSYIADGYIQAGYYASNSGDGSPIVMKSRTGMNDFGSQKYKFPQKIQTAGDQTSTSQNITIRWANEKNTFNTGRTVDLSTNNALHRIGRFIRRNHEIEYSGTEQVFIEGIDVD